MGVPEVSAETKTCPQCAEDIRLQALVCHFCGQEFTVRRVGYCTQCHDQVEPAEDGACPRCHQPVIDVVTESRPASPGPAPPPAVTPVAEVRATDEAPPKRRTSFLKALAIAVAVVVPLVVIAVFLALTVLKGEASDPGDLADRFPEAGVTCRDFDVIFDDRSEKALGCVTLDSHLISIFTYADRPSAEEFVRNECAVRSPSLPPDGAYVLGDGFIINILQGAHPGPTPTPLEVATRLAGILGGEAAPYACS